MRTLRSLAVVVSCLVIWACVDDESVRTHPENLDPSRPARVVLVSIDTLRADHVGFMGSTLGVTPRLDSLARRGTIFGTTFSPAPLTLPSHTTLLTGMDPPKHGVHHNGLFALEKEIPTLARRAQEGGLETAAFIGAVVLDRRYGIAAGFDHYDDQIDLEDQHAGAFTERTAEIVVDRALAWISQTKGHFFIWVHVYDPHLPWSAPQPYRERFPNAYLAEIAYTDAQIGRLVESVERLWPDERTLYVVTSDHGESLGEHGEHSHAYSIYAATQHVPLVMVGPGIPAGERVDALARLCDVTPTILARLGLAPRTTLDGRDLFGPIANEGNLRAYSETRATEYDHGWSSLYSLRDRRYHFVRAPAPELYDLDRDPKELENLFSSQPDRAFEMDAALDKLLSEARRARTASDLSASTQRQLAALGYLPNPQASVRNLGEVGGPSPRDGLALASRWLRGLQLLANGRSHAAFKILCEMHSSSPLVGIDCSRAALLAGEVAIAEERARRALGTHPKAELALAEVQLAQQEYGDAQIRFDGLLAKEPESGSLLAALGRIAEARGDVDRALDLYRRATTSRRPSYEGLAKGSALLFREGRIAEARELMQQIDPDEMIRPDIASALIGELEAVDDIEGARQLLRRATARYPDADALERWQASSLALGIPDLEWVRGRRLLELGKPDRAYRVLKRAADNRPMIELDRAWAAARSGRNLEAIEHARRASGQTWAGVTLAETMIRAGKWDAAERIVKELQAKKTPFRNLKTMLGRIAEGRGEVDRAIAIYQEASNAIHPSEEAFWRLASLEFEAGRRNEGEAALAHFHTIDPYAHARLVEAELAAGSFRRAEQRLRDALTRHPDADGLLALEARMADAPHAE